MTGMLPDLPSSIAFLASLKLRLSAISPTTSSTVFCMMYSWAGLTMIRPSRLMTTPMELGNIFSDSTRSVSQSNDISAVRIAAILPVLSMTGIENVVICMSPPPTSTYGSDQYPSPSSMGFLNHSCAG